MRVPLKLDKQGQPVMANDSSMSFKLNKSAPLIIPVTVPLPVPAPPAAGCVNKPLNMYAQARPILPHYGPVIGWDTEAISTNPVTNVTLWTPYPTPIVNYDPATYIGATGLLFTMEIIGNWCDQYSATNPVFSSFDMNAATLSPPHELILVGSWSYIIFIPNQAPGTSLTISPWLFLGGGEHFLPTLGINFI